MVSNIAGENISLKKYSGHMGHMHAWVGHSCMGHKVVVVFLEMAHIQVQYPLHLANKLSTNHHGNPVQFQHHRNNSKLEFLVDHMN